MYLSLQFYIQKGKFKHSYNHALNKDIAYKYLFKIQSKLIIYENYYEIFIEGQRY